MKSLCRLFSITFALTGFALGGCGGEENKVIIHTQTYELTEQEQANRTRAEKMLAEQRQ